MTTTSSISPQGAQPVPNTSGNDARQGDEHSHIAPGEMPHVLYRLDSLPHNINGKVDRQALAKKLAEGSLGDTAAVDTRAEEWQTDTERQLAAISGWAVHHRCIKVERAAIAQLALAAIGARAIRAARQARKVVTPARRTEAADQSHAVGFLDEQSLGDRYRFHRLLELLEVRHAPPVVGLLARHHQPVARERQLHLRQ